MKITFITGNQYKADYLAKWLGMPVTHQKLDLDELQSVDLRTIVEHKARQAYDKIKSPVLVEDVSLEMAGLNGLPGPLVKWFLEGLGDEKMTRLGHAFESSAATVRIMYALYDGRDMRIFEASVDGTIAPEPKGENNFGFARIFIPAGTTKTTAEMTDEEVKPYSHRAKAIQKLADYLRHA